MIPRPNNKVLIFALLLTGLFQYDQAISQINEYVVVGDGLASGQIIYGTGTYMRPGTDVAAAIFICDENSEMDCIIANKELIFAVPKENHSINQNWMFGGFEFLIKGIEELNDYKYILITAKRSLAKEPLNNSEFQSQPREFLYSTKNGLLMMKYLEVNPIEVVYGNGGLSTRTIREFLPDRRVIPTSDVARLQQENWTSDELSKFLLEIYLRE